VDETYVKVTGRWNDLYRAVDQHGQMSDVLVSTRRDAAAPHGISSPTRYDAARLRWRSSPTGRRSMTTWW
jgi:DDE superfamily endonuclease